MRQSAILTLTSLAALAGASNGWSGSYRFGNMFYTGPTSQGIYITKATYSMAPPSTPCNYEPNGDEELALWIGVQEDPTGRDVDAMTFDQPLLNWTPDQRRLGCETDAEHWCVAASTYTPEGQVQQPYYPVEMGKRVDYQINLNESTGMVDQWIWVDGEVLSYQAATKGVKPAVFYSGNECYDKSCGFLQGYSWTNITIHLSDADPTYNETLTLTGATTTGMETTDGGKAWYIEEVAIQKDYFYTTDSKEEC